MTKLEEACGVDNRPFPRWWAEEQPGQGRAIYGHCVEFQFAPGSKVYLDGDETLTIVIVSCAAHVGYNLYELSWINCGSPQQMWANGNRLTAARER